MKKIFIDKVYFDLKTPRSAGLVSALKKLSERNIKIYTNKKIEKTLSIILSKEKIKIGHLSSLSNSSDKFIQVNNKKKNLGKALAEFLQPKRKSSKRRKTTESDIKVKIDLDGNGEYKIDTGIGFFDHMLEQVSKHSNIDVEINAKGDLHIDEHHTVEDTGIILGEALNEALGNKVGIKRFGSFLPMDDSTAKCTIDLSGRSYLNFNVKFKREKIGGFPTELTEEFFRGITLGLRANIFIQAEGKNDHHKTEAVFKSFARALNEACRIDERNKGKLPSTKGKL